VEQYQEELRSTDMTLKEEIAAIPFRKADGSTLTLKIDSYLLPNEVKNYIDQIIEAFNKIVPDKKVVSRLELPRIVSKFEGFNQCVDQIEREINE
jgi:hypothetical protein